MTQTTWFWIGALVMALGAGGLAVRGGRRTQDEEGHTIIHGIVPVIAAVAYLAMALGQGGVRLGEGRLFWYARYVDWAFTTPLLLLGLAITALHGAHRRAGLVAALLGADVLMIVTGLFSGLSEPGAARWVWFVVSCAAFLVVYLVVFGPLRREAADRDPVRRAAFARGSVILAGLWLVYPVVVLLGPDGFGVWSATLATGIITVVDVAAKVGYGVVSLSSSRRAADADLAHATKEPASR